MLPQSHFFMNILWLLFLTRLFFEEQQHISLNVVIVRDYDPLKVLLCVMREILLLVDLN